MAKAKPASSGKSAGGGGGKSKQQKHSKPASSAPPANDGGSGGDAPAGARPAKKEKEPPAPHEDFSVGPRAPLRKVFAMLGRHPRARNNLALVLQLVFLRNENVLEP